MKENAEQQVDDNQRNKKENALKADNNIDMEYYSYEETSSDYEDHEPTNHALVAIHDGQTSLDSSNEVTHKSEFIDIERTLANLYDSTNIIVTETLGKKSMSNMNSLFDELHGSLNRGNDKIQNLQSKVLGLEAKVKNLESIALELHQKPTHESEVDTLEFVIHKLTEEENENARKIKSIETNNNSLEYRVNELEVKTNDLEKDDTNHHHSSQLMNLEMLKTYNILKARIHYLEAKNRRLKKLKNPFQ